MQKEATKEKIQKAFLDLISEKAFHKISIKKICERADINRSTYYYYYYEQHEILAEIIDELLTLIIDEYFPIEKQDLRRTLFCSVFQIYRNRKKLKVIMSSTCETELMHAWYLRWQKQCVYYQDGILLPEEYRDWHGDFAFYGIYSIYRRWIMEDCKQSEENICKVLENAIQNLYDSYQNS